MKIVEKLSLPNVEPRRVERAITTLVGERKSGQVPPRRRQKVRDYLSPSVLMAFVVPVAVALSAAAGSIWIHICICLS